MVDIKYNAVHGLLSLMFVLALQFSAVNASAQVLNGIGIGDPPATMENLGLQKVAQQDLGRFKATKFKLPNGNMLSVTYDPRANRIVYVENDWSSAENGKVVGALNLIFGTTTLEDIRKQNGSNGFVWNKQSFFSEAGEVGMFNAYEISNRPSSVVVYITSVNVKEYKLNGSDPKQLPKLAKLRGIIVANSQYLDEIWGSEKNYDVVRKPISWGK